MTDHIKGSTGRLFNIGSTVVYAGPRDKAPNDRHLKRLPVLAVARPGDKELRIVTEFPNSTSAEAFIEALIAGLDEASVKPIITTEKES
jgi:hypothetical protein